MVRLKFLFCGVLCLALSSGCALVKYVTPPAGTKLSYMRGTIPPAIGHAPEAGTYLLYAQDSPSSTNPSEIPAPTVLHKGVTLKKGDPYGFEGRSDGTVVAIAHDQEIAIGSVVADNYFWKLQKPEDSSGR